jgi:anti-anti-sigma regulatory factor
METDVQSRVVISMPHYVAPWDSDRYVNKFLRQMQDSGTQYVLDMEGVRNIYSGTVRLLMRLYDRAVRLGSTLVIVNADDPVCNALRSLRLDEKIPVNPPIDILSIDTAYCIAA